MWDMILDTRGRASIDICRNGSQLLLLIIRAGHEEDVKDGFGREEWRLFVVAPGDCYVLFRFPDGVADWGVWVDECIRGSWEVGEEGCCEGEEEGNCGLHLGG